MIALEARPKEQMLVPFGLTMTEQIIFLQEIRLDALERLS
jgi:hypothetical protein